MIETKTTAHMVCDRCKSKKEMIKGYQGVVGFRIEIKGIDHNGEFVSGGTLPPVEVCGVCNREIGIWFRKELLSRDWPVIKTEEKKKRNMVPQSELAEPYCSMPEMKFLEKKHLVSRLSKDPKVNINNLSHACVYSRIFYHGHSIEDSFYYPLKTRIKKQKKRTDVDRFLTALDSKWEETRARA